MYPSKTIMDYMTEFNRLFPNTNNENDLFQSHNSFGNPDFSPVNQSIFTNQSSSSADSTSPESYADISRRRLSFETPRSSNLHHDSRDNPFAYRRAITGRKIIDNQDQRHILEPRVMPLERNFDEFEPLNFSYQSDDSAFFQDTTPNYYRTGAIPKNLEQRNRGANVYELFPAEKKAYEFHTPVKELASARNYNTGANFSPISPISRKTSPQYQNHSRDYLNRSFNFPNNSPNYPNSSPNYPNSSPTFPNNSLNFPNSTPNFQNSSSTFPSQSLDFTNRYSNQSNVDNISIASSNANRYRPQFNQVAASKLCTFCRKNGETAMVYSTHNVKEMIDGKYVVTCPILRSHVCTACNESGDNAHTITYCPVLRSTNNGKPLQSTTITLKNTRIKSNGKRRY